MPTSTRLDVQPIAGALGAEISGVDLGTDLDDATIAEIRRALLDHCVIFFRDQEFDAEQHKRLARRFGEIFVHPNYAGMQADPEIVMIRREPGDTRVVGEDWHTDTTMMPKPPMGAILYAIEAPPHGGDTLFANQYLAYETLSEGMKRLIDGLRAIHSDRLVAGPQSRASVGRTTKAAPRRRVARDGEHASDRRPTPGNRPQGAVRQRLLHRRHRRPDRRREPAVAGLPDGARPSSGVHVPLPLDYGRRRLLGQPLRQAPGDQ